MFKSLETPCGKTFIFIAPDKDLFPWKSTFSYFSTKHIIMKTCLHNVDPLKPHFYIVKLGFTGVYLIFLILLENIDFGYLLELPHHGSSKKYPQSMF